jgi:hypothetical protein
MAKEIKKKHFRDEERDFSKYFPLFTYNNAVGAYDFLCQKGYQKQSDYISEGLRQIIYKYKDNRESEPRKTQPRDRRKLVVGLIFEQDLLNQFLKEIWNEKHASLKYRSKRMNEWYEEYKYHYKPRYGYLLKNL